MSSVYVVNERADVLNRAAALSTNINGATGLMEVMRSNLGPFGESKLLVGGAGQLKLTKDGQVLLSEMAIEHPTASMIARAATAMDSVCGDGTTTVVLFIGELLRQCERYIQDGNHSRMLCEGIDIARDVAAQFLLEFKRQVPVTREACLQVVNTAVRTKLPHQLANDIAKNIVDAYDVVKREDGEADLFMVEVMPMLTNLETGSSLVKGIVMDHGCRHADMPRELKNAFILTCNVSLEFEKTEVNATFFYTTVEDREKMVSSERLLVDKKVSQIIALKREVCQNGEGFVVLNQKGIDPLSLDSLAREGIMALRRVKRRNMERLTLCCGGVAVNSLDGVTIDDLGFAGNVKEVTLDDEKWTIVDEVKNPQSCSLVVSGAGDFKIHMMKDAIRDGLRAVHNFHTDSALLPGAGAYQVACSLRLKQKAMEVKGKAKLGVLAFAEALLAIPRTLALNSGFDAQEKIMQLEDAAREAAMGSSLGQISVGLNLKDGTIMDPVACGVWDNVCVTSQILSVAPILTCQLLMVDEIIKAGKSMTKG